MARETVDDKHTEAMGRNAMPTMIAGEVDDQPVVLDEIVEAALPNETLFALGT